ncbi:antitoxin [Verminephrobacter eiseniae]|uniref:antitoxin n=1 Tax=Verminephrobacter eiseniae TaxID=364317 RepID=UPI002238E8BF|nr:AbrB/MazE/SpoVT family DNA-binding domain-containing protein [Verminephrobacter eiseniae]MCW5233363.1 AbrB/MazE/SpoVT family DNA-binding domain-containing protein [Verminephrobacter eiseniae]MCW5295084.1 AbrB/MazE/SpoVT family DNA-binding domain-containing protein [Verminephrobacter eiseniae]MCW8185063.1 AbrB/MazE/SpoVT family DNA-binding domain-containing protein [Verminephrobacter eiseniae]MCW8223765.1 AbrB/MazE/SpoVT family DNA-binding domain-containing protein [Verminephrobacter eiseniae
MSIATFTTRQFRAGNSQAVRLPSEMAFPSKTELSIRREGDRIIIEPKEKTLADLPLLFAALKNFHSGTRPEFEAEERPQP